VAALLALSVIGLTGCGAAEVDPEPGAGGENVLTLGVVVSTTGPYAALGAAEAEALEAFEETAQYDGLTVDLIIENDESDPAKAAAAARNFAADPDIDGIIGGAVGATMLGMYPVLADAKVPWLTLTPVPYPNYNEEPYIFSCNLNGIPVYGQAIIDFYKAQGTDPADITVIGNDDASGQYNREVWTGQGIGSAELIPPAVTDFTPVLRGLQDADVAGLMSFQNSTAGGNLRRAQDALGYDVPLLLAPQSFNKSFLEGAGDSAEGVYVMALPSVLNPEEIADPEQAEAVRDINTRFEEATGNKVRDEGFPVSIAWDNALSFVHAALSVDTIDRTSLRDALETQEFVGVSGPVQRTSDDHVGSQAESITYARLEDGQLVTVPSS